jgi:hypothetical protein
MMPVEQVAAEVKVTVAAAKDLNLVGADPPAWFVLDSSHYPTLADWRHRDEQQPR